MCFTANQISLTLTSSWLHRASATGVAKRVPPPVSVPSSSQSNVEKSGKGEKTTIYHLLLFLRFDYFSFLVVVFQGAKRV